MHIIKTTSYKSYVILLVFFATSRMLFSQCLTSVAIDQGQTINLCGNVENFLTSTSNLSNYSWTGNVIGNESRATITGTGWIYVTATDLTNCTSTDSIFISYWLINSNPEISSSNGLTMCETGGATILSATAYNPIGFEWSNGATSTSIDVNEIGTYWVDVTDQNGCIMRDSIEILPIDFRVEAVGGNTICAQQSVRLEAYGGQAYNWSTGENSPQIVAAPLLNTTYQVTIESGGCIETKSIEIIVHPLPTHTMSDTIFAMPGEIVYITGPLMDTYEWGPSNEITSVTGQTTGFTGSESTDIIFNGHNATTNCTLIHSIRIEVMDLTIPEGFSPNGDGKNDFFVIPEIVRYNASLQVWNRWGDIVYESDAYKNTWDGTCQGQLCIGDKKLPDGTYFYSLVIKERTITGNITLKR